MKALHSVDEVAAVVRSASVGDRRVLVGIAGPPGAGKSTLAAELVEELGQTAAVLPMDGFHFPQVELEELGRRGRMGAPDTFDVPGLLRILHALVHDSGATGYAPGFDRETEEPVPDAIILAPHLRTVVVEGNYLLLNQEGWAEVADYLDLTFYLDLDRDVRLERLVARHERFGKPPQEARAWALGPDEANAKLIESTATSATHRVRPGRR